MVRRQSSPLGSWLSTLGAVAVLAAAVGFLVPKQTSVDRSAYFARSEKELWGAISGFAEQATWRSGVNRVFALPDRDGHPCWREIGENGALEYSVIGFTPPHHMMLQFSTPGGSFRGSWTFKIEREEAGSRLTIAETGELDGVLRRILYLTVLDRSTEIDRYLIELGANFGETTVPEGQTPARRSSGGAPDLGTALGLQPTR
jgi:hypothetical protein